VRPGGTARQRLLAALPAFAGLLATPLVFDRICQPFWVYLCSGVFAWWSVHKLFAFCLGRGPLPWGRTLSSFCLMLAVPAAFIPPEDGTFKVPPTRFLRDTAGQLAMRFASKLAVALAVVPVLSTLMSGAAAPFFASHRDAPPGPGKEPCTSGLCLHIKLAMFNVIVYCFFSLVMDLPVALLRSMNVRADPHITGLAGDWRSLKMQRSRCRASGAATREHDLVFSSVTLSSANSALFRSCNLHSTRPPPHAGKRPVRSQDAAALRRAVPVHVAS
jgi:hypothetical protein